MNILFASYVADPSASGRQRHAALCALGHEAKTFALDGYDTQAPLTRRARRLLARREFSSSAQAVLGERFVSSVAAAQADIVWVEKPLMLLPQYIDDARQRSPRSTFVCFQDDDPFGSREAEALSWRHFVAAIPLYDVHFVKKQANVEEFVFHGAKHALLFMHGVHTPYFYPRPHLPSTRGHDVLFVGTPLDHRVSYVEFLLRAAHVPLHVYGNSWQRKLVYWQHRARFHNSVAGDAYASLLSASKICLGFVSSSNRDEYSMRTFEIPGSGSFLLAERSPTHEQLFAEGVEAEFFSSAEECANKSMFYLRNDAARQRIARAGYERCARSGYLLTDRIRAALEDLQATLKA